MSGARLLPVTQGVHYFDTIFWFGYQTDPLQIKNSKTAIIDYILNIQDQVTLDKRCLINPERYAIVPN
jgi:hypothetical protein